jgi:ribonuclease BN (tRNA processing enzyme)
VKITFLGSGGAFTDYRVNYHNNALVETGDGLVLIDCGFTACQSLRELGIHPSEIKAVLFTHLHADHASPEQLIWERYYSGPDGLPSYLPTPIAAPGELLGPMKAALQGYIDIYSGPDGKVRDDGVEKLLQLTTTREVEVGGVRFRYFRVPHVTDGVIDKDAFGLEIIEGDRHVFWSGDTTFEPRWIREAADQSNTVGIFHECMFGPRFPGTVHTHWEELLSLPEDVRRRIVLMHHTAVPDGMDISAVADAARRHQSFIL